MAQNASYTRLSTVVCQELSEAAISAKLLEGRIMAAIEDGVVTPEERADLIADLADLNREMGEAMLTAEETDLVEATFEFRRKVGMTAPLHQRIREKARDVEALRAQVATLSSKGDKYHEAA